MTQRERRPSAKTEAATEPVAKRASTNRSGRPTSTVSNQVRSHPRRGAPNKGQNNWKNDVLPVAKQIVESYDTGVTLRQLFYRLVSLKEGERGRLANTNSMYTSLAHNTAEARDAGTFPDLVDQRRAITVAPSWESPHAAIRELRGYYRRDHTEGQRYQIVLGVEKVGMVNLLRDWFADMGLPIIALSGQCSKPYRDKVVRRVRADGRPPILLYAGDHDPTGWSIIQNFVDRTGCWANPELPDWDNAQMPISLGRKRGHAKKWSDIPNFNRYRKYRVALTPEQCDQYDLTRNGAKAKDPNLNSFLSNFADTLTPDEVDDGLGVQVEVDALTPSDLRRLFTDAIGKYWNNDTYQAALAREKDDLAKFDKVLNKIGDK